MEKVDGAIKLAYRAVETKFEDLSEQDIFVIKQSVLDTLGVILAASTLGNKCKDIVSLAKEMGGKEESTILGFGGKVPAIWAAMANGAMVHSLDYDDVNADGGTHPTAASLPVALALMEKNGNLTGKELITALAVGNDMVVRCSLAQPSTNKHYGVWAPLTMAIFGAAISAGKVLRLTKEEMVSCLGIALFQTSGTCQIVNEGGSDLREIYQAFAAQYGILSAVLAQKGIKGSRNNLEGQSGFYNIFVRGDYDPSYLDVKMGDSYLGVDSSFKPYSACMGGHCHIDATRFLVKEYNITPERVEKVIVKVGKLGRNLCIPEERVKKPSLATDARFSIPWPVAACLVYGNCTLAHFENLNDPKILAMAQKIEYEFDEEIGKNVACEPGHVTVKCTDGSIYSKEVIYSLGTPQNPMSMDDIIAKFKDCASYSVKPITAESLDRVIDLCLHLEEVNDISEIIKLIS